MLSKQDIEHAKMPRAEVKALLVKYLAEGRSGPPRPRMSTTMMRIMQEDNMKWGDELEAQVEMSHEDWGNY